MPPNQREAKIPNTIDRAFSNCTSLASVDFGDNSSLASIGNYAFSNCTSLASITIPDNVASISWSAFSGCTIKTVTMPTSAIESIPKSGLQTVILTSGNSIGNYAFEDCTSLASVTIPDSVTSIGMWAFDKCTSLVSITIPEGVTSIGLEAFYKCTSLASVDFGDNSSLTIIDDWAFYNCTTLVSITLPESVTSIGYEVFEGCTSLKKVYYGGTSTQWGRISIGAYNDNLKNADRYYYSAEAPDDTKWAESNNWWHYDPDTGEIQIWKKES